MSATKDPETEPRSDPRTRRLLEAALDVFATKGYRTARLDDVAEAAGVTKGAIYHHFDSKEALLLAVITHYQALAFERAESALEDESVPASARIRLVVRKVFTKPQGDERPRLLSLLIRGVAHEVPKAHDRWLREGPARFWTLLARLVEEGKARGEFRPDADGEVGARILVSGLMLQLMWRQHDRSVRQMAIDVDRLIDSSVDLFLAGLRAATPPQKAAR